MKTYIFEVRDSDGNDTTVFDALVEAPTREDASLRLWEYLGKTYPDDESDGGYGTLHACDCACEHRKTMICSRCSDAWECSHGGLLTNEDMPGQYGPKEFESYQLAYDAHKKDTYYHSLISIEAKG